MLSKIDNQSIAHFIDIYNSYDSREIRPLVTASDKEIEDFEQAIGFTLPNELKQFYQTIGGISTNYDKTLASEWMLDIYTLPELTKQMGHERKCYRLNSLGIVDMILFSWMNERTEFDTYLSEKSKAFLNDSYKSFGMYTTGNSGEYVYLYFDENGLFGKVRYNQTSYSDLVKDYLSPMLKGTATNQTFDECMAESLREILQGIRREEL